MKAYTRWLSGDSRQHFRYSETPDVPVGTEFGAGVSPFVNWSSVANGIFECWGALGGTGLVFVTGGTGA